jgi:peptide-methionine (S)-S-oxide reductase
VSIWDSLRPQQMVSADTALPGREMPVPVPEQHAVLHTPLAGPYPEGTEVAEFALGCFWGQERLFWQLPGVFTTAAGYQGGFTPNPSYEEVCTGRTGHAEAVRVVFDPAVLSYQELLRVFWENHDPTQGMQQGNDIGTQYRSMISYHGEAQRAAAEQSRVDFQERLRKLYFGDITTEIVPAGEFYFAEEYHQQYMVKVPDGYCPDHSTGVTCPVGLKLD